MLLPFAVEHIPDEDGVSRHFDSPYRLGPDRDLLWDKIFEFMRGGPESLVWRKYKQDLDDVHALGCLRQAAFRQRKPSWTYEGAATATVAAVRALRNARGHGFVVQHEPGEGQYHAEISRKSFADAALEPADKAELLLMLTQVFGVVDMHQCPDPS